MEHYVRLAPDHYTVAQALRYGEVRGMGGGERLALEITLGRLGRKIEHSAFWRTVLCYLFDILRFVYSAQYGIPSIWSQINIVESLMPTLQIKLMIELSAGNF